MWKAPSEAIPELVVLPLQPAGLLSAQRLWVALVPREACLTSHAQSPHVGERRGQDALLASDRDRREHGPERGAGAGRRGELPSWAAAGNCGCGAVVWAAVLGAGRGSARWRIPETKRVV